MNLLAIDPGAKGGLAVLYDESQTACCHPMPQTEGDLLTMLRDYRQSFGICYLEHVGGTIPGGGYAVGFSFGHSAGYLEGCLDALGYRTIKVRPQKWQKWLSLGGRERVKCDPDAGKEAKQLATAANAKHAREWKNKLKAEAQRRFPGVSGITLSTADALLILDYARAMEGGAK